MVADGINAARHPLAVILESENVASSDEIELPNERGTKLFPAMSVSRIK